MGSSVVLPLDRTERYARRAILTMLFLAALAAGIGTLIHWYRPIYQPAGLIIPAVLCVSYLVLALVLPLRPGWLLVIARIALLLAWLALVAASWGYTMQALFIPGLELVRIFPPVSALLLVVMVMVMLFFPGRDALRLAVTAWALVALPVLIYLFFHPHQMLAPRGEDLLMAFGPLTAMSVVLLPMQRGLREKINRLMSERGQMEEMANRDPLTDIYNRRLAVQVLSDIFAEHSPAGVIMFDMDQFKAINDTHGHAAGDRVLRMVALRCKDFLRQYEIISRWGGEEFLVVVRNVDAPELAHVAERLRSAVAHLDVDPVGRVTASFGIALVREGDDCQSVLKRVDRALYQAKRRGGNRVVDTGDNGLELVGAGTEDFHDGRAMQEE